MSWGLPPKHEIVHQFSEADVDAINYSVETTLKNNGFVINSNTGYLIDTKKTLSITFMSLCAFTRPKINLLILITNKGRLTLKSNYNYNSMFGIAMNDRGVLAPIINTLLSEIITAHENN